MKPPSEQFLEWCSRASDAPALIASGETTSYGELQGMVHRTLEQLDRCGIAERAVLAMYGRKSARTIATILACMSSGRPVLVLPLDLREHVRDRLLEHTGAELLLEERLEGDATQRSVDASRRRVGVPVSFHGTASHEDTALILVTSGSTGSPKAVPLTQAAIARFAAWAGTRFGIGPGARVLSFCDLSFDLSIFEVWTTLMNGGCAVVAAHDRATQGDYLLDLVQRHAVTVLEGVPLLYELLTRADEQRLEESLPSSVRHVIVTGDFASARCLQRVAELFRAARIYNVYGCTETNDSFLFELRPETFSRDSQLPIGSPLPGVSALLLDDQHNVVSGPGQGELWVSTPFQTNNYLGPAGDGGAFAADPLGRSSKRYFRSGDMVSRTPDGEWFLTGRRDRQVKVRGVRVDLQAIENVILEAADVCEAAVFACEQPISGQRVCAVVRGCGSAGVDTLALRRWCARRLTRLAIPSIIEVRDKPLPRTATGKIDRKALSAHSNDRH
jgi:amino acid adenylation domain-containing protein